MFITKRKHESQIALLKAELASNAASIAQLEARAIQAEQSTLKLVEGLKQNLHKASAYSTAGEAAYAYADEFDECKSEWASANQDLWEYAACGAILFGQQHAADAQIAFFKLGACVPYYIDVDNQDKVMSAQLTDPVNGGITIKVNGEDLRYLETDGLEHSIQWFTNLVTSPPGWLGI
ncbi:hypothetical protein [Pseudomonas sp. GXZC]|uniref:hypothetical protein n=1 Tax=Pseudomonas sp. GXZC TaxID=3003351 RepID=UPI0022AB3235|nr:hypothetical protein [Pseudomonas sp. GXZC]WAT32259.1 hypothetical protein OZ428_33830 [Pseudomonas sp. GXZC]